MDDSTSQSTLWTASRSKFQTLVAWHIRQPPPIPGIRCNAWAPLFGWQVLLRDQEPEEMVRREGEGCYGTSPLVLGGKSGVGFWIDLVGISCSLFSSLHFSRVSGDTTYSDPAATTSLFFFPGLHSPYSSLCRRTLRAGESRRYTYWRWTTAPSTER